MPKLKLPDDATALWRWMERFEVTVADLAAAVDVTPNYLGDVRRGVYTPSDELKLKLEAETRRIEIARNRKRPRGVVPGDWFPSLPSSPSTRAPAKQRRTDDS